MNVTIAWDRNPEPQAVGYYVYVGKAPGVYDVRFDAGRNTSYVYSRPLDGKRYYFAVTAYGLGGIESPKSEPVSHVAGMPALLAAGGDTTSTSTTTPTAAANEPLREVEPPIDASANRAPSLAAEICGDTCYTLKPLRYASAPIAAMATLPDGRVLSAEKDHILIYGGPSSPNVHDALTIVGANLTGVAVDPAFARTRWVYVSEVTERADGTRDMAIVRYREVQGTLGDPAAIVSGLTLPAGRVARVAAGLDGYLYIAMPSVPALGRARDPYAGAILRFAPDGTVPRLGRGVSPVIAQGLADPSDLAPAAGGDALWIGGTDETRRPRLGVLDLTGAPARIAGTLTSALPAPVQADWMVTAAGELVRCARGIRDVCSTPLTLDGYRFTAVTQAAGGVVYAGAFNAAGESVLLELRGTAVR